MEKFIILALACFIFVPSVMADCGSCGERKGDEACVSCEEGQSTCGEKDHKKCKCCDKGEGHTHSEESSSEQGKTEEVTAPAAQGQQEVTSPAANAQGQQGATSPASSSEAKGK